MAIVITEYKLTKEQLDYYNSKGYPVYSVKANPKVPRGTAVIFELKDLHKNTMDKINSLLYSNCSHFTRKLNTYDSKTGLPKIVIEKNKYPGKHNITLKYNGIVYHLNKLEEWSYTYQSDKDVNRTESYKHPVLRDYEKNYEEWKEKYDKEIKEQDYNLVVSQYDILPTDMEVDIFLDTYAKLYGIYVPQDDKINRLKMYQQIKFYLDNKIEPDYIPDEDVEISIGNATMLDDFIYKNRLVQD